MAATTETRATRWATGATVTALIAFAFASISAADPSFSGLGPPSGYTYSRANGVSDNSVVAGMNYSPSTQAFRWTLADGMVPLEPGTTIADAISADGTTIVGYTDQVACYWDSGGVTKIGDLPGGGNISHAYGISPDGSVIVGVGDAGAGKEAFRWTRATGSMEGLGSLEPGAMSFAYDVSSEGAVIVGNVETGSGWQPCRWDSGGITGLGYLDGYTHNGTAYGVSADGQVVVGVSEGTASSQAFRLVAGHDMEGLGHLSGDTHSTAKDTNADGSLIVGYSNTTSGTRAFIWDETHEMRDLRDVLVSEYDLGDALTGWTLDEAHAISPNGRFIAGEGTNPSGQGEAWVVDLGEASGTDGVVPEPISMAFMGSAFVGVVAVRLRKRRKARRG